MSYNKIVLITNIPNQYRIPLFNEFAKILEKNGKTLHIIFGANKYASRKTKVDLDDCEFEFTLLETKKWKFLENDKGFISYENLLPIVKKINPDQIIVGGFSLAAMKICLSPKVNKIPLFLWSGAISNTNGISSKLRAIQRKLILKRVSGVMTYSNASKSYFSKLGVPKDNISVIGNTVDVSFFKSETIRLKLLNQPSKGFQLTYVGYLTERKAVNKLLLVIKQLTKFRQDVHLNIVGSGDQELELKKQVIELNINEFVSFCGFVQKHDIPAILAKSDLFMYQTDFDIWGLVLNEAMAAGVPCFASINAVSTNEMIEDGKNGYKVNFDEHDVVAKRINEALNSPEELIKIATNAQELIMNEYSLDACANRMSKALLE